MGNGLREYPEERLIDADAVEMDKAGDAVPNGESNSEAGEFAASINVQESIFVTMSNCLAWHYSGQMMEIRAMS